MGNCSCLSEKEQHDVTIEKGRRSEKASEQLDLAKQQETTLETDVADMQNTFRSYTGRHKTRSQETLNELLSAQMFTEEAVSDFLGRPEELLVSAVRALLAQLPDFEYSQTSKEVIGKGPARLKDGSVYVGEWFRGARFGKGKLYCVDGSFHEGHWRNGRLQARGRVLYASGDYYEGDFCLGVREGKGKLVSAEAKSTYQGEWLNDKQHGLGTEDFSENGSSYTGQFSQGVKEGFGRFQWADGSRYEGSFRNNILHGPGHYLWGDGRQYIGPWENNQMHGKGKFMWPDGRLYEGDYKFDKKEGYGLYRWEDGKLYEGPWRDGKMHGIGFLSMPGKPRRQFHFVCGKKGAPVSEQY